MRAKRNMAWARFVRDHRKAKRLTRRRLAELSSCDPSYITLIERDGYVPLPDKVESLGKTLGQEREAYIFAGYIPPGVLRRDIAKVLDYRAIKELAPSARQLLICLMDLPACEQEEAAEIAFACVDGLRAKRLARKEKVD